MQVTAGMAYGLRHHAEFFVQMSSTVSARKARLKLDDDSDSDTESTRQKHLSAVARRKAANTDSRGFAVSKPPASAQSVPQVRLLLESQRMRSSRLGKRSES